MQKLDLRINSSLKIFIHLFAIIFIFASYDSYVATDFTLFMREHFVLGIGASRFFSIMEIFLFVVLFLIIRDYGLKYKLSNIEKYLLFFAILCQILNIVNPNNTSEYRFFGMNLLNDFHGYSFLFFLYVFIKLDIEAFIPIFNYLFKIFIFYAFIRAIILLGLWVVGKGAIGFGFNSTLIEGDTLYIYGFLLLITVIEYYFNGGKKNLFYSMVFFLILLFSYRRSAIAVVSIATLLFIIFYYIKSFSVFKKILVLIIVSVFYFSLINYQNLLEKATGSTLIFRYISALPGMSEEGSLKFSDSGHWDQSLTTAQSAIENAPFWGVGYGNVGSEKFEGASKGVWIHNIYAAAWLEYGVHLLLFYIFIFILLLYFYFNSFLKKKEENNFFRLMLISGLISYMLVLYTNPLHLINHIRMEIIWGLMLIFIIKTNYSKSTKFSTHSL